MCKQPIEDRMREKGNEGKGRSKKEMRERKREKQT